MTTTVIPAGYRITITSWENDADNYNTKVMEGQTELDVKFWVDVCKMFRSKNRDKNAFGNMYDPSESEIEKFGTAAFALFQRHPEWVKSADFSTIDVEHAGEYLHEVAYDVALTGGEFYTRVFDTIKIEYIPQQIELEDVTSKFI